jgi:hypothetical protein
VIFEQRLDVARLEEELQKFGYARRAKFHEHHPIVLVIDGDDSRIAGRYFPSRNAILVVRHRRSEVTRALVNHEMCHALQYARRCGGTCPLHRRKCGYVGEHDAGFYRDLERIHREYGVRPAAARVVEEESGYGYPRKRWGGAEWPGS